MATLILGTVGTLIGGPLGGTIGSLIGQSIDGQIFGGGGNTQGPRIEELAVSTSSYGQPIARHYGRMRTAGSIIWATDLQESSETSGGKGKPKVTTYSYSISFAVALASRPIDGVGRIWADGNLLRGAAGDLKTGGTMRLHNGHGDQARDPLLAAALGAQCPANRSTAYVVFEDLQLADFGNRIPALSFEIFAGSASDMPTDLLAHADAVSASELTPTGLEGFSHSSGSIRQVLDLLHAAKPLAPDHRALPLRIDAVGNLPVEAPLLPDAIAGPEGDFGRQTGMSHESKGQPRVARSVRYYDVGRDYQTGIQTSSGRAGSQKNRPFDFPGSFNAANARSLAQEMAQETISGSDRRRRRIAALDPAIGPGSLVRLADAAGIWRIVSWELGISGVELELNRYTTGGNATAISDPGVPWQPQDRAAVTTELRVFELPWDGQGSPDAPRIYAAASAAEGRWSGASLSVVRGGSLSEIAIAPPERAITGETTSILAPSRCLLLEPHSQLTISLPDPAMVLASTDISGLASGSNRILMGREVVQYLEAHENSPGQWRLRGLLRGRGGTEHWAQSAHQLGTSVTLLDHRLVDLSESNLDPASDRLAALGIGDDVPVLAEIENAGVSRKPLTPVHPQSRIDNAGILHLCWTRRARGYWSWLNEVDAPLVEPSENYQVGVGPVAAPHVQWVTSTPTHSIEASVFAELKANHAGAAIWVRQIGSHARSDALLITRIA